MIGWLVHFRNFCRLKVKKIKKRYIPPPTTKKKKTIKKNKTTTTKNTEHNLNCSGCCVNLLYPYVNKKTTTNKLKQ